jgi:hypothetical protein
MQYKASQFIGFPIQVIINIHGKVTGNSLCNYLKQIKMSFFFLCKKSENKRAEQVLPGAGGLVPVGGGRWCGKDVRG